MRNPELCCIKGHFCGVRFALGKGIYVQMFSELNAMIEENRQLVTDEPVESEK